jgi:hypothetical protein
VLEKINKPQNKETKVGSARKNVPVEKRQFDYLL